MQVATVGYQPSGSLARLLLKNAALNLITLTFYRFWAKTRTRQYFWQAIRLEGEPFEYTGLGRELLIGFLIVLAVLAPATLIWSVAQTLLNAEPIGLAIAQGIYFFVIYILIQAATFRARRYRLARTRWRGIRAGQDGSTWRYVGLSLLWAVVTPLTLGFGYPAMRVALQRFLMRSTRFGNRHFTFDAPVRPLLKPWLAVIVPTLLFYASLVAFFWEIWSLPTDNIEAIGAYFRNAATTRGLFLLAALLLLPLTGLGWLWYRLAEFRHFVAHTRLGEISMTSRARARPILWRIFLFVVALLIFIVLGSGIFTLMISVGVHLIKGTGSAASFFPLGLLLAFFAAVLLRRFWWTLLVTQGLLRHVCETMAVSGLEALGSIAQTTTADQKYGEGLADSFEVAG